MGRYLQARQQSKAELFVAPFGSCQSRQRGKAEPPCSVPPLSLLLACQHMLACFAWSSWSLLGSTPIT